MGKYMKKSKITGDVVVMEVLQPTSFVRTRAAKTIALQRIRSCSPLVSTTDASATCYLQLRSRRLEKPLLLTETRKQQHRKPLSCEAGANTKAKSNPVKSVLPLPVAVRQSFESEGCFGNNEEDAGGNLNFGSEGFCEDIEASFGENSLDFEVRDRSTRESTPFNLIRNSETIATPGSTSRRISPAKTYRRNQENAQRIVPSTREIEEFFAYAEQQQQRSFTEKYNFDIVNDIPLPGRYEWVQELPRIL